VTEKTLQMLIFHLVLNDLVMISLILTRLHA